MLAVPIRTLTSKRYTPGLQWHTYATILVQPPSTCCNAAAVCMLHTLSLNAAKQSKLLCKRLVVSLLNSAATAIYLHALHYLLLNELKCTNSCFPYSDVIAARANYRAKQSLDTMLINP
jgi:hypothetical protein